MKRFLFALFLVAAAAVAPGARLGAQTVYFNNASSPARLGVSLQDVTPRLKEREKLAVSEGAYVTGVSEESPAERAGIEEGDVIVSFHGAPVTESDDLIRAVKKAPTGEPLDVVVNRAGEKKTLSVKLRRTSVRSYSFGHGNGQGFTVPTPPTPPSMRNFRFNLVTSQGLEGMVVQKLTKQLAEYFEVADGRGLLVTSVEKRSAASEAGIKAGDVIVRANADAVREIDDLREAFDEREGKSAELQIVRHGKSQTVSIKVEREDEDEDDDDLSYAPRARHLHDGAMRAALVHSHRDLERSLQAKLGRIQERIREKMERLRDRLNDEFFNM